MKTIKTIVIALLLIISVTNTLAQQKNDLIGTWKTIYEENGKRSHYTFQFTRENGNINCYTIRIEDDKGNATEEHSIALDKIIFSNEKGSGNYTFEHNEEKYEVRAKLRLINKNTLVVSYSQWGYSDKEIWRRIN